MKIRAIDCRAIVIELPNKMNKAENLSLTQIQRKMEIFRTTRMH